MGEETPYSLATKVIATLATNLYVGSSAYISLTEVPARWVPLWFLWLWCCSFSHALSCYCRGKASSFSGNFSICWEAARISQPCFSDWVIIQLVSRHCRRWLPAPAQAGILIALTVWTFAIILPINMQLVDGTSKAAVTNHWQTFINMLQMLWRREMPGWSPCSTNGRRPTTSGLLEALPVFVVWWGTGLTGGELFFYL